MWLQKIKKGSWLFISLMSVMIILQSCLKNDNVDYYDFNKILEEDFVKIDQYISDKGWDASIDSLSGIRYVIHVEGDPNIKAEYLDTISLHYQGELLDGTQFDSSIGKDPLKFVLGSGSLIPGFEAGVAQLHEMDSATILIPSGYAYGNVAKGSIPANSPLVFGLDVLSIGKSGQ